MPNPLTAAMLNPVPSTRSLLRLGRTSAVDLSGKTVLLTGASSGIGEAVAYALADRGARVIAVARNEDALARVCGAITASGGEAYTVTADMADADSVTELARVVLERFGPPDVVVNNAGRSIRRTAIDAADRAHDYERTMAVNYFGPVRLTLALLPELRAAGRGHFINIGTWGTTVGVMPKFSAYHASKAALAAFSRSVGSECHGTDIAFTTIGFPLVRTPMISPTAEYDAAAALTPGRAAEWVLTAIRDRPAELYPSFSTVLRLISTVSPKLTDSLVRAAGI
ncbi:MAG: SDR family NAD(P)-dependent oxidoreductase [Rhodococcus sp. (in: high G+C Gram-positive bacteria)]|uniref:SDR family NAD(P)-dependent oxidoreductase n=1 Tax=Rhodococcus sp. TaxID=1831 RepID=UPI002AD9207F|nr:SDR family NAD(P)-dependent oxidoreductase [Rhodococcus sp. (in: high G+C Gram-positive bacteria)]